MKRATRREDVRDILTVAEASNLFTRLLAFLRREKPSAPGKETLLRPDEGVLQPAALSAGIQQIIMIDSAVDHRGSRIVASTKLFAHLLTSMEYGRSSFGNHRDSEKESEK